MISEKRAVNPSIKDIKSDFRSTNNEHIGKITKKFKEYLELDNMDVSKNIVTYLSLMLAQMVEHRTGSASIHFNSIYKKGELCCRDAEFNINLDFLGLIDPDDLLEDNNNGKVIHVNSDYMLGLCVKNKMIDIVDAFRSEDDLMKHIFEELSYCVMDKQIDNSFSIQLPIGNMAMCVKFDFNIKPSTLH
jgi:hypothetical protein